MISAPRIAILPEIDWNGDFFVSPTYYCHANYIGAIQEAGGTPVIIPQGLGRSILLSILDEYSGICLVGGPGITHRMSGELPPDLKPVNRHRVDAELAVLAACVEKRKPVLGICYGMQLMNVARGGTLLGDLHASNPPKIVHAPKRNKGEPVEHRLHLNRQAGGSQPWAFLDSATVNSYHLQSVDQLGRGFECIAHAEDGIPEVIQSTDLGWIGCQFHPERCPAKIRKPIFKLFVGSLNASGTNRRR